MKRFILILPLVSIAVFFLVVFVWLETDKRFPREAFQSYSIYNSSDEGLSLAFKYLRSTATTKGPLTLTRPVERAFLPSDAVLFRIRPDSSVYRTMQKHNEKKSNINEKSNVDNNQLPLLTSEEKEWIQKGGRLILAIDRPYTSLSIRNEKKGRVQKVFPIWQLCNNISLPFPRVLEGEPIRDTFAIFVLGNGVVVMGARLGKGEMFILACPEIFQNRYIGEADHLALLSQLAGTGRAIYFDEYVHGMEGKAGVVEILSQWGFGPFIVIAIIFALVAFWRFSYRIGPGEDDYRETRIEAIDFIDSLSILYNRAIKRSQALSLYRNAFVQSVSRHTGLRDEALQEKVRELLTLSRILSIASTRDLTPQEFRRELTILNDAFRSLEDGRSARNIRKTKATVGSIR